jgi:LPS-assembly protein
MIKKPKKDGKGLIKPMGVNSVTSCRRLFACLFWFFLLGVPWVSAQETLFSGGSPSEKAPWDIEARELNYDQDTNTYTAIGEVVIKKGDRVLKSDYARLDRNTMIAEARGNVEYTSGGDELRGDQLTIDLRKQTGEVEKGRLFLKKNNYHVTGTRIWKTGESTYRILEGTITSCDGEDPPWIITAKDFDVTVEGYGQLYQASLRARNIPVLYTPYLIFPVKTKRQSGLLFPEPGYSQRDGLTLNAPFYWAISDSQDATFYQYLMSKRGYMQGAEFRYVSGPNSKGAVMADYLSKDMLSEEEFKAGRISEPYNERYWIRGKANQDLPKGYVLKVDLDWVSDRDYLKEFRAAGNGLDRNRPYFLSEFGRDFDDETVLDRRNTAIVTRSLGNYNFTGGFQYYQELDKTDDALNQLPYLRYDSIKYELGKNIFFQLNSNYNYYWRKKLDRGQFLEINPILSYPYKLRNVFNTETSVGANQAFFQVENRSGKAVEDWGARTVPYLKLDLSTDIQRVFDVSDKSLRKIKHNIRPQVVYDYTPEVTNYNTTASLPTFISPLIKTNTITYYLNNTLTAKNYIGPGKEGEDLHSYLDFVYFKIYQTFDLNEAARDEKTPRNIGTTTTGTTAITGITGTGTTGTVSPRRPFSNVTGELEFIPSSFLRLRSYAGWSPYDNQFDTQTYTISLNTPGGSWASVDYQTLNGDQYRQINTSLLWKINPIWTANFLNRFSIDQNKNYETTLGLAYAHQCWGIKATYTDTLDDKRFLISFSLKGLGEF